MPGPAGDATGKLASEKGWEIVGKEIYPTGTTDYSVGLLKAKKGECPGPSHRDGYAGKLHPSQTVVRYENPCRCLLGRSLPLLNSLDFIRRPRGKVSTAWPAWSMQAMPRRRRPHGR